MRTGRPVEAPALALVLAPIFTTRGLDRTASLIVGVALIAVVVLLLAIIAWLVRRQRLSGLR